METCIQWYIQQVKNLKSESYDENMLILNESLKLIRGIKYYDSEEYTIFSFPRSEIQPYIIIRNSVSMKELLKIS